MPTGIRYAFADRVPLGGGAPIVLKTMTAGYTHDVDACIAEIQKLARAGEDAVRMAVPTEADTGLNRPCAPHLRASWYNG
ncbi:MAG: flavodoxin-dependent (E)-4-hydroxy-3-methylbut-2-enyl-diphosphate synthase [Phycisphaerales bacterium]|nr:flavodoxin-dependent (E)-4-hydroxy-3-methylbut-2-enyl-diphosphate synthase [Phycisphaerales bacterium]